MNNSFCCVCLFFSLWSFVRSPPTRISPWAQPAKVQVHNLLPDKQRRAERESQFQCFIKSDEFSSSSLGIIPNFLDRELVVSLFRFSLIHWIDPMMAAISLRRSICLLFLGRKRLRFQDYRYELWIESAMTRLNDFVSNKLAHPTTIDDDDGDETWNRSYRLTAKGASLSWYLG